MSIHYMSDIMAWEYLFDGFTISVTARITAAVIPKLSGYTCMIVVKDGAFRNTVKIHVSRTPQIPTTAQAAGMNETPKPLRYPDRFSCAKLNI